MLYLYFYELFKKYNICIQSFKVSFYADLYEKYVGRYYCEPFNLNFSINIVHQLVKIKFQSGWGAKAIITLPAYIRFIFACFNRTVFNSYIRGKTSYWS